MSDAPITPDSGVPVVQLPTALDVWAHQPFQSRAEEREAFASSRYSDSADAAYRAAVEQKLSITSYDDEPRVRYGTGAQSSNPDANARMGRALIVATEEDHAEIAAQLAERDRVAARDAAIAENERQLAGAITIPDLKQVDPTKPATPFKDREEQIKFMSARDENGNLRYDRDAKYRDWVIERIAASSF